MPTLRIRQDSLKDGRYPIRLTLKRQGQPDREAEASIEFELSDREQEEIRWYLEDYLQKADVIEAITVEQIEGQMRIRGEELYTKVLAANQNTQALWFSVRDEISDLRIEVVTGVAEAASIPWELMRDPIFDSAISLRVKEFVRVQSNPTVSFVSVPPLTDGRIRLLYIACRPGGARDVELRAVANRLLNDLGSDRARFDIKALRPPTFERLQKELADAKAAGRPYHIVHFDGHGIYADLSTSMLADWKAMLSSLTLGSKQLGTHGYLLFEHPSEDKMRPVDGHALGQLLRDNNVPVLILNACQSAMHEAAAAPRAAIDVHDEVRAIGSLAQAIVDQGIPAVLGMRYSVYVVTAAQYIGELYSALAKGRSFGQAATEGRKHLKLNPERWLGLKPLPLQDWFVPVVFEAMPIDLVGAVGAAVAGTELELDPIQLNQHLLRYVPEEGFVGRDETILALDRAFDDHRTVLLHAYAGQGKSSTSVEFARWYSLTKGLGNQPLVLLTSFEKHTNLVDLLNQIGQILVPILAAQQIEWNALNDLAARRKVVTQVLRQVPVLWIWDNIEPIAGFPAGSQSQWTSEEQRELRDFLQQLKLDNVSKVKILLTSRRDEMQWLGGIPHRITMRRMKNSDAAKLALNLGKEKGISRSEIADWQPLLDYCAGNPLTLRVLISQAIKANVFDRKRIAEFVEAVRGGEQQIEDVDEQEGRDKSLRASLDYGFKTAFTDDELPIIALLHFFQGTVYAPVLLAMGEIVKEPLRELSGWDEARLKKLLKLATESGLLSHSGQHWFSIHPVLPWFLKQRFTLHYDGAEGRSSSQTALAAWVEAVGGLANHYHSGYIEGNTSVIRMLALEEDNFLHARNMARRNRWWASVIRCMSALRVLYQYQGRSAEWAKLVEEIRLEFCDDCDEALPGLENQYDSVMEFRVAIARKHERNLEKAAALQEKHVEWCRRRAVDAIALPADSQLDENQRDLLNSLGMSLGTRNQIARERGDADCVKGIQEVAQLFRRIQDRPGEAIAEHDLGLAYKYVSSIRDLDASESAFHRSLKLQNSNDGVGQSRCLQQIAMVHHDRFVAASDQNAPKEELMSHVRAAETFYLDALQKCPTDAATSIATLYGQIGNFYSDAGKLDLAHEYFERAVQNFENAGDRFGAGSTRYNIALRYARAANLSKDPSQRRPNMLRARAYAAAALRDFQHFEGRLSHEDGLTRELMEKIDESIAHLNL